MSSEQNFYVICKQSQHLLTTMQYANVPLTFPKSFISFNEHDILIDIIISSDMQHSPAYHEYVSSFYRLTAASN